jgi:streptogramin lyase
VSCTPTSTGTKSSWTAGNTYLNGADFDFAGGEAPKPGYIKLVTRTANSARSPTTSSSPTAWSSPPTTDLVISESFAGRLTAFDIDPDGGLSHRRVFAEGLGPDGICVDAEGAIWVSTGGSSVVRVAEGGEVCNASSSRRTGRRSR